MRPGSAMQIKGGGDRERRAFNPDRDLVWALGRLVKRLGSRLAESVHTNGEIDAGKLGELLAQNHIYAPIYCGESDKLVTEFAAFIKEVNDYFQALHGDMTAELTPCAAIFDSTKYGPARSLFSLLLVQEIFAEHPFWWAQVKPNSTTDPQPDVKTIDVAVRELLGKLAE